MASLRSSNSKNAGKRYRRRTYDPKYHNRSVITPTPSQLPSLPTLDSPGALGGASSPFAEAVAMTSSTDSTEETQSQSRSSPASSHRHHHGRHHHHHHHHHHHRRQKMDTELQQEAQGGERGEGGAGGDGPASYLQRTDCGVDFIVSAATSPALLNNPALKSPILATTHMLPEKFKLRHFHSGGGGGGGGSEGGSGGGGKRSGKGRGAHPSWMYSSTGSLYMSDTIKAPDMRDMISCISLSIYSSLVVGEASLLAGTAKAKFNPLWSEVTHPISKEGHEIEMPSVESIETFLRNLFVKSRLSVEIGVMAVVFMDRLLVLDEMVLQPSNWRRVFLACIILSSKIWEELAVWNVDFRKALPELQTKDLLALEMELLTTLQFYTSLKTSVYAKYYFELRALSNPRVSYSHSTPLVSSPPSDFPPLSAHSKAMSTSSPVELDKKNVLLTVKGMEKLESASRGIFSRQGLPSRRKLRRTVSLDSYVRPDRKIILS